MPPRSNLAGTRLDFHRGKGGVRAAVSDALAAVGWDEGEMGYVVVRVDMMSGSIETHRTSLREAYRLLEATVVRFGDAVTARNHPIAEQNENGKWQLIAECSDGKPRFFYAKDYERPRRGAMSAELRFKILNRDDYTCRYCGRSAPDVVLHVDHVKPVARGGTDDEANLVTACADCNHGKGARYAA